MIDINRDGSIPPESLPLGERRTRQIPLAATLAVGASAAVLFAIEPFAGKVLLPRLGGSPSVWNSCVMVFQMLLLGGYGYSALLVRVANVRKAVASHAALVVVSIALWPWAIRALWLTPDPDWPPVPWVVATTVAAVGLPFAILSATSPLLQVWLARGSPVPLNVHRLYAASNIASVAGLVAYVALLEPFVGVTRQSTVLWIGYAGAMALAMLVIRRVQGSGFMVQGSEPGTENQEPSTQNPEPIADTVNPEPNDDHHRAHQEHREEMISVTSVNSVVNVGRWIGLSFGASLCLYAVNTYITTDVASFPLLWCLPLGIFLTGFAAGFSSLAARARVWVIRIAKLAALAAIAHLVFVDDSRTLWVGLLAPLVALAFVVTALAAELAHRRPPEDRLAGYYVWVGLGGVLAGIVSVVVLPWAWSSISLTSVPLVSNVVRAIRTLSPVLLNASVPEYAASLLLALGLLSSGRSERHFWRLAIGVSVAVLIAIAGLRFLPDGGSDRQKWGLVALAVTSAFIASARGTRLVGAGLALAMVGAVVHAPDSEVLFEARNFFGTSRVQRDVWNVHRLKHGTTLHGLQSTGEDADRPASYYGLSSPLGQVMDHVRPQNVLIIGLGVGTIAAYGRAGDRYRFVEINPLVRTIATNPQWFSYITAARGRGVTVDIDIGDGRLLAETLENGAWDLIVVDAFSSDAIPVHLLSAEAVQMFNRKLSARGILAYHISNRFFDLHPVIAAAADRFGMPWAMQTAEGLTSTEYQSTWVMLAGGADSAQNAGLTEIGWVRPAEPAAPWTDDWANVLGTLRSWRFWETTDD